MLTRRLLTALQNWQKSPTPLLLRGARQVGKTHLITHFGQQYFDHCLVINFEQEPRYKACFDSLKPKDICHALSILSGQTIIAGKSLLFLDEIQDCPVAIQALRYFKEQMPDLHVIGAGSLLELALRNADFRMPVGRVMFHYLYPLSFSEYLHAHDPQSANLLQQTSLEQPIPNAIHQHLLRHLRQFFVLGGMPAVLANYQQQQDIQQVQMIQANIITAYENDFGHYDHWVKTPYLRTCYQKVPLMIGQQIKYNKIDSDSRSRDLKVALSALEAANIIQRVQASNAQGLPLASGVNDKKFKYNFVDIGLVKRFLQVDAELLLNDDIMLINKGALAEQFVGQELLANAPSFEPPKLFFWARDGHATAEIDYLFVHHGRIYPIEVKSGKLGTLRSLKQYLLENPDSIGIRISPNELSFEQNVLSVPLYMISELPRLLDEYLEQDGEYH